MRVEASGKIEVDVRIDGIAAGVAAQSEIVGKLAGGVKPAEIAGDPWQAREQICNPGGAVSVLKLSVLPAQLGATAEFVREALASAEWSLLMHSTGLAWLRCDASDCSQIADFITALREYVAPAGGTAVLLKAPAALRQKVDVWGETKTALRLMKRIKEQFDPSGILNRGRFVGGI
jgi:glycolate oxidase FAD binding subunit